MKRCKKGLLALTVFIFSLMLLPTVEAGAASAPDCLVTLDSPGTIEGMPLYEMDVVFTVTNETDANLDHLVAYLSFVDIENDMIYDDEFGSAGETPVHLPSLAAGESTTITIPLQIAFAGQFRIAASVVNLDSGRVAVSDAVSVTMTRITAMHNSLVIAVAAVVPVICIAVAFYLTRRKKRAVK